MGRGATGASTYKDGMGQECGQTEDPGFSDRLRSLGSNREIRSENSGFRGLPCRKGPFRVQRTAPGSSKWSSVVAKSQPEALFWF